MCVAVLVALADKEIKLPVNLERLAAKAEEAVDVTLSGPMLRLAEKFISDRDADAAKIRNLIAGLDGIYVRSFTFARDGEYNMADVDALRAQVQAPAWSRIVGVTSKRTGEDVDVFFKIGGGHKLGGILIFSAETPGHNILDNPRNSDPHQLVGLGGVVHISRLL